MAQSLSTKRKWGQVMQQRVFRSWHLRLNVGEIFTPNLFLCAFCCVYAKEFIFIFYYWYFNMSNIHLLEYTLIYCEGACCWPFDPICNGWKVVVQSAEVAEATILFFSSLLLSACAYNSCHYIYMHFVKRECTILLVGQIQFSRFF